jgi:hypothetical protein
VGFAWRGPRSLTRYRIDKVNERFAELHLAAKLVEEGSHLAQDKNATASLTVHRVSVFQENAFSLFNSYSAANRPASTCVGSPQLLEKKAWIASATLACCWREICGNIGKEIIEAATRSATGKSPQL